MQYTTRVHLSSTVSKNTGHFPRGQNNYFYRQKIQKGFEKLRKSFISLSIKYVFNKNDTLKLKSVV